MLIARPTEDISKGKSNHPKTHNIQKETSEILRSLSFSVNQ